jgi:carboxyl-terminal processing protease
MRKVTVLQIILLILISFFGGYYFGVNKVELDWKNYKANLSVTGKEPPSAIKNIDFSPFWIVWQKIEDGYYDKSKIDPQKMINGAISGALSSLDDPFTVYLPPVQNTNFKQGLAGQFSGIGAELGVKGKDVVVIAPIEGSPAEKAGIKAADTIVKVDGVSTAGWNISQVVEKIRGPKATDVTVSVIHKDAKIVSNIKITRDVITVKSVAGWIKKIGDIKSVDLPEDKKELKITYIRLSQFGDSTNKDWEVLINSLRDQIKGDKNVKGLVLDLRSNPGGYLSDAVFIASEFLTQGTPVVSEENYLDKKIDSADRTGKLVDVPLVILIDRGSASASEIVSGALRDNKKAILVGETSYGKGTVQQAEDLGGGSGLHITVAKWLTPNRTWVNGVGLKPDFEVKLDPKNPARDTQLEKAIKELIK